MKVPCKDCQERFESCHSCCEKYKAYSNANKERLDQQYKESKARAEYRDYRDRVCKERK